MAEVLKREGRLDVLFANAGISAGPGFMKGDGTRNAAGAIENLSLDTFDHALAVNLRGALATIQAAVPPMKRQRHGRIIVTTSISLIQTETLVSTLYVASKAALGQLVRRRHRGAERHPPRVAQPQRADMPAARRHGRRPMAHLNRGGLGDEATHLQPGPGRRCRAARRRLSNVPPVLHRAANPQGERG